MPRIPNRCKICGKVLTGKRADAVTCGPTHRKALSRGGYLKLKKSERAVLSVLRGAKGPMSRQYIARKFGKARINQETMTYLHLIAKGFIWEDIIPLDGGKEETCYSITDAGRMIVDNKKTSAD